MSLTRKIKDFFINKKNSTETKINSMIFYTVGALGMDLSAGFAYGANIGLISPIAGLIHGTVMFSAGAAGIYTGIIYNNYKSLEPDFLKWYNSRTFGEAMDFNERVNNYLVRGTKTAGGTMVALGLAGVALSSMLFLPLAGLGFITYAMASVHREKHKHGPIYQNIENVVHGYANELNVDPEEIKQMTHTETYTKYVNTLEERLGQNEEE